MNPRKFTSGKFVKHFYKKEYEYESFLPEPINKAFEWEDKTINVLLSDADRLLGELNAYSRLIPDVDFFIQMHILKEATTSSKIEGTKTEMDDAILPEEEVTPEKRDDWNEVQNHIKAIDHAVKELNNIPLCMRLITSTHKILMSGVRGKNKEPGEIRKSQNWIGGSSPRDAFFIPPHHDALPELLTDFEKFLHNTSLKVPKLIQIALAHYQFETIHPFLDGNGRIGRVLITLQLLDQKMLDKPTLYLSGFFEKNRTSYFDALSMVRESSKVEHWIKFFLSGVIETAKSSIHTFDRIIELRQKYEQEIMALGRRVPQSLKLFLHLYSDPVISIKSTSKILGVSFATASKLIQDLTKVGILKEITGSSRNRLFLLHEYVDLFKDHVKSS